MKDILEQLQNDVVKCVNKWIRKMNVRMEIGKYFVTQDGMMTMQYFVHCWILALVKRERETIDVCAARNLRNKYILLTSVAIIQANMKLPLTPYCLSLSFV